MNPNPNPIVRLLQSSKALVMLAVVAASFGALYTGKATWDQVQGLVQWLVGVWMGAQGIEDAAKHVANRQVVHSVAKTPPAPASAPAVDAPKPGA